MKIMDKILAMFAIAQMLLPLGAVELSKISVSSYPWQKTSIVRMESDLAKIGMRNVSMFPNIKLGDDSEFSELKFGHMLSQKAREHFKKFFDSKGLKVVSYGHMRAADEAEISEIFEFAKFFGIDSLTVECPPKAIGIYEKYAKQTGVKFGLYNHPNSPKTLYPTPESMLEATRKYPQAYAFADCGHWGRSGFDIVSCAEKLKGRLLNINVQDLDDKGNCQTFGKGVLPLGEFLKKLRADGFDGFYVVMFSVSKNPLDKIEPSVEFLKSN